MRMWDHMRWCEEIVPGRRSWSIFPTAIKPGKPYQQVWIWMNLVYKSEQLFKLIFGILGRVNLYSVPAFAKFSANVEDRKHMPGVRRANHRDRKRVLLRGWQTIYMPRVIWIVHSPWPQIERIWKKMTVKRCQTSGLCTPSHSTDSLIVIFPIDIK